MNGVRTVRSTENKLRVLNEAMRILSEGPESELRIADIYERTGLSSSVIYSYFRSRDGLIDAAYIELFKEASMKTSANLEVIFNGSKSTNDAAELFFKLFSDSSFQREWQNNRKMRIRVAARAVSSIQFMKKYKPVAIEQLEKQIAKLQSKNLLTKKFTSEQAAHIFEGVIMALTVKEDLRGESDYKMWFSTLSLLFENE